MGNSLLLHAAAISGLKIIGICLIVLLLKLQYNAYIVTDSKIYTARAECNNAKIQKLNATFNLLRKSI